jgi:hypothetical protein
MKSSIERISLQFDLSDKDIPDIIFNSIPPADVKIGKPSVIIKASSSGGAFVQMAIQFAHDVHEIGILVLAQWLYECFVKSGKKKGRINNEKIVFNKRTICRLIKQELKNQIAREKQRRDDKNRPPKKRP